MSVPQTCCIVFLLAIRLLDVYNKMKVKLHHRNSNAQYRVFIHFNVILIILVAASKSKIIFYMTYSTVFMLIKLAITFVRFSGKDCHLLHDAL